MCGRYTLTVAEKIFRECFNISPEGWDYRPSYNICPGAEVPVVYFVGDTAAVRLMRWGLIPKWAKDASMGRKMINARGETVHEKPAYKVPFARQRCLIPADGFYEWQTKDDIKIPHRITMPGNQPFAFAGLWDCWLAPEGSKVYSFSIVTADAGAAISHIHNRMPVILADNSSREMWLDPNTPVIALRNLLLPYQDELLSYPVSPLVNSPKNDFPELILRIDGAQVKK